MTVLDSMVKAATSFVDSFGDLGAARGAVFSVVQNEPEQFATNDALALWGTVRAAVDQGLQPIVVINTPRGKFPSPLLNSIHEMTRNSRGQSGVVIRGIDNRRNAIVGETFGQAMARAASLLESPVDAVTVNFPTQFDVHTDNPLPLMMKQFISRNRLGDIAELTVNANYPDANLFANERMVRGTGHSVVNGVQNHLPDLLHYSAVGAPTQKWVKRLIELGESHLSATGGRAYSQNIELLNNGGQLNVKVQEIPRARFVTHQMDPDARLVQAESFADFVEIASLFTERTVAQDMGLDMSRSLADGTPFATARASDYGLAT